MEELGELRIETARSCARFAASPADMEAIQRLRAQAFRGTSEADDRDIFDDQCHHGLVETDGRVVACFRIRHFARGAEIDASYAAQFYELSALQSYDGAMVEMGRFCTASEVADPDILRLAWALLTRYVERGEVALLFGCSSFIGTSGRDYLDAFSLLKEKHLAPSRWLPQVKAPRIFPFANLLRRRKPDLKAARRAMPPLLKTYLAMGGWVSDHAVIDRDLGTLHVFTGLEIAAIPAARKRLLHMMARPA